MVVGTLVGPIFWVAPAHSREFKLWPLVRWASVPQQHMLRWTALGPVVEYFGTPEGWTFRLRPVLTIERRYAEPSDVRADFLFPLARLRATDDNLALRFLLFTWRSKQPHGSPTGNATETALGIYPFVFYRRDATGVSGGVFPFYLDLHDVLGYDRVRTVLFPAFLTLDTPRVERRYYLFPFLATVGGPDGDGGHLWPIYGDSTVRDLDHTSWILWPFHIRRDRALADGQWEHQAINTPWFARSDRPGHHTRGYGLLGVTHTIDEQAGTEAIGSPWPLVLRERRLGEEAWFTWRLAPVYGRTDRDGFSSRFYAWPLYRWHRVETADTTFERSDLLLLLWRWQRQTLPSGRDQTLHTLFPLWRAEIDGATHRGQIPALVDSILPTNRGVLDAWAPLYGVLRWDTSSGGDRDWNLLWGLLTREQGRWHGPLSWQFEDTPGD